MSRCSGSQRAARTRHRSPTRAQDGYWKDPIEMIGDADTSGPEVDSAMAYLLTAVVWVRKDHSRGVLLQGFLDDLTGIYGGAIEVTAEHHLVVDHAVALIEKDHCEDFVIRSALHRDGVARRCSVGR
jgi:hypothetical protein